MPLRTTGILRRARSGLLACAWLTLALPAVRGASKFPPPDWVARPDPVASPYAVVGGEIVVFAGQSPKSFNYYLDNNVFTARVFGSLYETLLTMDPTTLEYEPYLAERWSISDDKRTFTFHLDPKARWSDGRPISAADVRWTYDTIMAPENMTGPHKVSLERLEPPVIIDAHTVSFTAREVHWQNLGAAGGFEILPKHVFEGQDFNRLNFEFPVVSGLYRLGQLVEGISLSLERRADWWRKDYPQSRSIGNFQTIRYRFFADRANAFEAFRRGDIDMFAVYTARVWVNETQGERFDNNWIVKQKIHNHQPIGFQGFAMNMRRAPFDDVRVREAMARLLNRRKMNATLMYDQYFLHRSYFEDLYGADHPCPNERIEFDKDTARALLREAGWAVNPQTGILEKDGRRFSFRFLTRDNVSDMFLAIYAEDLKDVGIELRIDTKDWAAWAKDMDEFNYDMTWAAWSAGLFKDPEGMWHSKEAERQGGNNITGFKNARVDELVEQQRGIFDVQRRHAICREIDQIVVKEFPYVLLWNIDYVRLLYWNKFGTPDTVLSKYGSEGVSHWWWDADAAAALHEAMRTGRALPRKPETVVFGEALHDHWPAAGRQVGAPTPATAGSGPATNAANHAEPTVAAAYPATSALVRIRSLFFGLVGLLLVVAAVLMICRWSRKALHRPRGDESP